MEQLTLFEWYARLRNKSYSITFRKADGTETTKIATLREEYLPPMTKDDEKTRLISSTNVTFWSVEDKGWRTFKIENVISYEELIG